MNIPSNNSNKEHSDQPLKKQPEGNTKEVTDNPAPEEIIKGAKQEEHLEQLKPSSEEEKSQHKKDTPLTQGE